MEKIKKENVLSVGKMTKISLFAAISGVLMLFSFPIPIAPPFMKIDFADVATLISGFALGPVAGVITVILKNIINILLNGTTTAYVGEISNIIVNSTFVVVSSLIYNTNKSRKTAAIGLVAGTLAMSVVATLSNYFVIFPIYAKAFGMELEGFVKMMPTGIKYVRNYMDLMLFAVVPFNLVKGILNSIVTLLIYKNISKFIKNI